MVGDISVVEAIQSAGPSSVPLGTAALSVHTLKIPRRLDHWRCMGMLASYFLLAITAKRVKIGHHVFICISLRVPYVKSLYYCVRSESHCAAMNQLTK